MGGGLGLGGQRERPREWAGGVSKALPRIGVLSERGSRESQVNVRRQSWGTRGPRERGRTCASLSSAPGLEGG